VQRLMKNMLIMGLIICLPECCVGLAMVVIVGFCDCILPGMVGSRDAAPAILLAVVRGIASALYVYQATYYCFIISFCY
jgi:hypothetical protein